MDRIKDSRLTLLGCLFLAAATLAAFWPVIHYDFINCDDQAYVYENPALQAGLSWQGVAWAFTTGYAGNWHPLTWLSHILDVKWFGLNAGWHHLTSLLLHIANTLLLFVVLRRMTGALWRSAFVAALFALHPLHVESVAWIAERKDVLSAFFFMLTLWAYGRYAECRMQNAECRMQKQESRPTPSVSRITDHAPHPAYPCSWYWTAVAMYACGLMSKPMLVTLPFVLLLLDYWPLGRMQNAECRMQNHASRFTFHVSRLTSLPLLVEKLPFFALAAASSVVTLLVQQRAGAVAAADALPLELRLENAVVSYLLYLAKTVWPFGLAIFYPYRHEASEGLLAAAVLVLIIILALAWVSLRQRPYVTVGWLWFLGMLVPVIGIVQVGQQAMADRYTYIPLIGVFIGVVWAAAEWGSSSGVEGRRPRVERRGSALDVRSPDHAPVQAAAAHPALKPGKAALPRPFFSRTVTDAVQQVPTGGPGRVRAVALAGGAGVVIAAYWAVTCCQVRHWQDSQSLFRHALEVTTDNALAHESLGDALAKQGRIEEAEPHFAEAVRIRPKYPEALSDLGLTRVMHGKVEEGIELYRAAIAVKPSDWKAHNNLARALCLQGKFDEGVKEYQTALGLNPGATDTRGFLAAALVELGKPNEAKSVFEEALKLKPDDAAAQFKYASLLMALGQAEAAAPYFRAALQYGPGDAETHRRYGLLLGGSGNTREAIEQFREAIRLQPGAEAHYNLATALLQQGDPEKAAAEYRESLRLKPDSPASLNDLAWVLAAGASDRLRNGTEAVALAEQACQLTQFQQPMFIGTLAAAYAEAGRFPDAVKAAEKAKDLAAAAGLKDLAERNRQLLELYRAGRPFHEARQ
jgi:tetratricopeptide (TPR) repeat protein